MALAGETFGEITTLADDFQYLYRNSLLQNKSSDSFSIKLYYVQFSQTQTFLFLFERKVTGQRPTESLDLTIQHATSCSPSFYSVERFYSVRTWNFEKRDWVIR